MIRAAVCRWESVEPDPLKLKSSDIRDADTLFAGAVRPEEALVVRRVRKLYNRKLVRWRVVG